MPLERVLEPQEIKLATALKNGECYIFAGAGVSLSIIDIDPIVSEVDAKTIRSTVRSWAGLHMFSLFYII